MTYNAVARAHRSCRPRDIVLTLSALALSVCLPAPLLAAEAVVVPFSHDFPESITATSDGALIFSSFAGGHISRAAPGATEASEWIKPGTNGLLSVLGVLADEKSNTLYACSVDASAFGVVVPTGTKPGALKTFDLKTGAPKASYDMPPGTIAGQTPLCNDMVVADDGTVYVTDTLSGRILRLKKGASALETWATDPRWDVKGPQLDGIAILADGNIYANIFEGDGLYRIEVKPDGSAGAITKLDTSRKLYHSDGLRRFGPSSLIMVEGEKVGTLDLIKVSGDTAKIETVQGGFDGPVSLVQVGDVAYVLDDPLRYMLDPELSKKPGPPIRAIPVKLPSALPAIAQEKTLGNFRTHAGFKDIGTVTKITDDHTIGSGTVWGVVFNDAGRGLLNMGTAICPYFSEAVGGELSNNGECTWSDASGDKIFTRWSGKGDMKSGALTGDQTIQGGTGKFAGIEGTAPFKCQALNGDGQFACTTDWSYQMTSMSGSSEPKQ